MDADHHPFDGMVTDIVGSRTAQGRLISLGSAMHEVEKSEISLVEKFYTMQEEFRNMSDIDIKKLWSENHPAIEKIRTGLTYGKSLGTFASEQVSGAARQLQGLVVNKPNEHDRFIERHCVMLLIEQHYQRMPTAAPQALGGPAAGFQSQSVMASIGKSMKQNPSTHHQPPQPSGPPRLKPMKNFYGRGEDGDMDSLFGGPVQEPPYPRMVSSTLASVRPDDGGGRGYNHRFAPTGDGSRLGSLDLYNVKKPPPRGCASQQAGQAAIERSARQQPYQVVQSSLHSHTQNNNGYFQHKPNKSLNPHDSKVGSDGLIGRANRPSSAPAPRSGRRRSRAAVKAPVEGSNREQAIAIEESDEEAEEGGQKVDGRQHNTRRCSERINHISLDNDSISDAKRYDGYRCVYPPPLPPPPPPAPSPPLPSASLVAADGEMTSDGAQANNDPASDGVRALSHAGASTSAPTAPSDEGPKPVKKKKEKRRAVEVVSKDFERLEALEFLNDTCIDFYLRHIEEHLPACMKERCHFFNSFFYKKLAEKVVKGKGKAAPSVMVPVGGRVEHCDLDFLEDDDEEISPDWNTRLKNAKDKHKVNHERVKNWTKGVDIFRKDFIFIPIHAGLHWSLIIICHPGGIASEPKCHPIILHFDSMNNGHPSATIFTHLRYYLYNEWERKKLDDPSSVAGQFGSQMANFLSSKNGGKGAFEVFEERMSLLPMQDNHCDCGLFLLAYTEFFCHAQPKSILAELIKDLRKNNAGVRNGETKRVKALRAIQESLGNQDHLGFFKTEWFDARNTGMLREYIKHLMLELMHQQALDSLKASRAKESDKRRKAAEEKIRVEKSGDAAEVEEIVALEATLPLNAAPPEGNASPPLSPLAIPPVLLMMEEAIGKYERKVIGDRYLSPGDYMQERRDREERDRENLDRALEESLLQDRPQPKSTLMNRKKRQVLISDDEDGESGKKKPAKGTQIIVNIDVEDEEIEIVDKSRARLVAALDENAPSPSDWEKICANDGNDRVSPTKRVSPAKRQRSSDSGGIECIIKEKKGMLEGPSSLPSHEDEAKVPKRRRRTARKGPFNSNEASQDELFEVRRSDKAEKKVGKEEEVELVCEFRSCDKPNYHRGQARPIPRDDAGGPEDDDDDVKKGDGEEASADMVACSQDQMMGEQGEEGESNRCLGSLAEKVLHIEEKQSILHGLVQCQVEWEPGRDAKVLEGSADMFTSELAATNAHKRTFKPSPSTEGAAPKPPLPFPAPPSFPGSLQQTTSELGQRRPRGSKGEAMEKEVVHVSDDGEDDQGKEGVKRKQGPEDGGMAGRQAKLKVQKVGTAAEKSSRSRPTSSDTGGKGRGRKSKAPSSKDQNQTTINQFSSFRY